MNEQMSKLCDYASLLCDSRDNCGGCLFHRGNNCRNIMQLNHDEIIKLIDIATKNGWNKQLKGEFYGN